MTPPNTRTVTNPSGRTQVVRPSATALTPALRQRFSDLGNYNLQVQATLNIIVFRTSTANNFPLQTGIQEATNILGQHGMKLDGAQPSSPPQTLNYNGGDVNTRVQVEEIRNACSALF